MTGSECCAFNQGFSQWYIEWTQGNVFLSHWGIALFPSYFFSSALCRFFSSWLWVGSNRLIPYFLRITHRRENFELYILSNICLWSHCLTLSQASSQATCLLTQCCDTQTYYYEALNKFRQIRLEADWLRFYELRNSMSIRREKRSFLSSSLSSISPHHFWRNLSSLSTSPPSPLHIHISSQSLPSQ